ncbi:zinc finger protein 250 [Vanessa tameamea]|uniref:Zinc finger protein 250 n=1 Tax=Vanessa tameamea TaxID=334116 RepID=A0A8B8HJ14_VANTA
MSADAATLPCPICLHTGVFDNAQSLKDRLIFVSTNKILCPVCQEEVSGLDKLTIHLFSHVKIISTPGNVEKSISISSKNKETTSDQQKKMKPISKNKASLSTANIPMKYVKIYPKLPVLALSTMPIVEISPNTDCNVNSNKSLFIPNVKTEATLLQTTNKCNICGLQFVDTDILRMHKCLIHNIEDNSQHTFTRYNCHLCTKHFKMRGSLMVHLRVAHYGFTSNNSSESSDSKDKTEASKNIAIEDKPIAIHRGDGKQWQCEVCRKCFTTKYFLKKHKRLHTGETPYACTQCNKTFTFQQSYHKHLLYHNDEKPHTCNFCGRAFKELSTLHNHQRIHTGEKPFACETCGKCFRQRVSYLVHRRIHTGAMPYKCTACEKSFRYKVSQRTHKCLVQPPGTVVRKVGELVEKLKKKQESDDSNLNNNVTTENLYGNTKFEVSEVNAELVRTGAKLSLEDMESENFTIISEAFNENHTLCSNYPTSAANADSNEKNLEELRSNIDEFIDSVPLNDKSIPSPSEILKNLCLSNDEDFLC